MTDQILPALNAEEWMQYGSDRTVLRDFAAGKRPWGPARRFTDEQKLHAVAAMALFHQPFGFTHDDVQLLDREARAHELVGSADAKERTHRLKSIARRIAALLPPPGAEPVPPEGPLPAA